MRYLRLREVIYLHHRVIEETGGSGGIRDLGALESALAQPRMTFGGEDLYPDLADKASALCYSIVQNHPFVDGNKRVGHAAIITFLEMNRHTLRADVDDQERVFLGVASGAIDRNELLSWIRSHIVSRE